MPVEPVMPSREPRILNVAAPKLGLLTETPPKGRDARPPVGSKTLVTAVATLPATVTVNWTPLAVPPTTVPV